MKGLDILQGFLDALPKGDPTCRNAWCGWWERNNGVYERHTPAAHLDEPELIDGPGG